MGKKFDKMKFEEFFIAFKKAIILIISFVYSSLNYECDSEAKAMVTLGKRRTVTILVKLNHLISRISE